MVDMASIAGALTSLKAAGDITKMLATIRDKAMLEAKAIELNGIILSAQQDALAAQQHQSALLTKIRELETSVAGLETWRQEKQRYELKDYGGGTFAYELKPSEQRGEPTHRICAKCYANDKASILQFRHRAHATGRDQYACPECDRLFEFGVISPPPTPNVITARSKLRRFR